MQRAQREALARGSVRVRERDGAPDRIRTCGLCLRRAALYPAELRVRGRRLSDDADQRQGANRRALAVLQQLTIAEAVDQMIVNHPDRLHVGVDDGRADEAEAALLQVL